MTEERKTELYNLCDPEEPLDPQDVRNVNIEEKFDEEPRGSSWVRDTLDRLKRAQKKRHTGFFCGLRGSGKSTELRRLAAGAALPRNGSLLPVIIDAEGLLDLSATVDLPDVLLVMLYGVEREVLKLQGSNPGHAMKEGPFDRLWHWFNSTEITLGDVEVTADAEAGLPGGAKVASGVKLALALKERPSLRAAFRDRASAAFERFLGEVRGELDQLVKQIVETHHGVLVILDSLEKLRGTSTTWKDVHASAEKVFRRIGEGLDLPVHAVYTVPPSLHQRLNIPGLHFMPMIKLHERVTGAPFDKGIQAARALIRQRVPDQELAELLGSTEVEERVTTLIQISGGYPRELIRLLQDIVIAAPFHERRFQQVLARAGDNVRASVVTQEAVAVLARVARYQALTVPDELRPFVDELLDNNVILRYQNQELWYEVHPAVIGLQAIQEELARLKRSDSATSAP